MSTFKHSILFCLTALISANLFAGPLELYVHKKLSEERALAAPKSIQTLYFDQIIDHENPETGTFKQRYWVDKTYGYKPNAPVLFYICGEDACSKGHLSGAIREYAKQYGAKLVALEHRYYGKSIPVKTFSTEDLRFLTIAQALDDLAYFQKHMMTNEGFEGSWVSIGGSYPGSLSAYYRLKHPELVVGSLASSAPVMAKEDFYEYDEHVTKELDANCLNLVRQAYHEVENALDNETRLNEIKAYFAATEVKDNTDFLYLLADMGAYAVQYGSSADFCNKLSESSNLLKSYGEYAQFVYEQYGTDAVKSTSQGSMSERVEDYSEGVGERQWFYQSCTEYGYWQIASKDESKSARSQLVNLDFHHKMCERLFGLKKPADTKATNKALYFPLLNPEVSNIYFTNGSQDPWSNLSITHENNNDTNQNLTYFTIENASHCNDLRRSKASDSESMKAARSQMRTLLDQWLL